MQYLNGAARPRFFWSSFALPGGSDLPVVILTSP
jgi:hypothetical protein